MKNKLFVCLFVFCMSFIYGLFFDWLCQLNFWYNLNENNNFKIKMFSVCFLFLSGFLTNLIISILIVGIKKIIIALNKLINEGKELIKEKEDAKLLSKTLKSAKKTKKVII